MNSSQTWSLSSFASLLLAIVAALAYLVGRQQLCLRTRREADGPREIVRAMVVAKEFESIAERLRKTLAAHLPTVERFNSKLKRMEGGSGTSRQDVTDLANELLKPALRLSTEVSHAYTELLHQMTQLASFAELRADPLTGINNRRVFDESLKSFLAQYTRYAVPFSVALVDIDHFKEVNDRHGHLHGDRVLQELAQLLKTSVRDCDVLARYGGEEFAILLPSTELYPACNLARRIRSQVEANTPVTLSVGLAATSPGDTAETLISRADAALYTAKGAGRNCIYLHEGASGRIVGVETEAAPAAPCEAVVATTQAAAALALLPIGGQPAGREFVPPQAS